MDENKKELSFEDFYESLFKTIVDELETAGVALVRVNDHAVGMFKAPDTLTEGKDSGTKSEGWGGISKDETVVEEDFEGNVINFKTPDTIN